MEDHETACPFCETALVPAPDVRLCKGPCSGHPSPRLGRVAMMALGTTLLCAACFRSGVVEYGPAIVPDAGAHPGDAGGETVDAGGQPDADPDAAD